MLAESELQRILRELHCFSGVTELVEAALERVVCCPICRELFSRRDELTGHLEKYHADRFVSSGSKQIKKHCVEEGDRKINICPHCHFAVGVGSQDYGRNSTSIIWDHVKKCPRNLSRRSGPPDESFYISYDVMLIGDYLRNCAESALRRSAANISVQWRLLFNTWLSITHPRVPRT